MLKFKKIESKPSRIFLVSIAFFLLIILLILLAEQQNESFANLMDGFYWAIVTITTTGYGDQIPKTFLGRLISILAMIFGVVVVSIATGRISSFLVDQKLRENRGVKDLTYLKDHILICGFKSDLKYLINDILYFERGTSLSDIVLINGIGQEKCPTSF